MKQFFVELTLVPVLCNYMARHKLSRKRFSLRAKNCLTFSSSFFRSILTPEYTLKNKYILFKNGIFNITHIKSMQGYGFVALASVTTSVAQNICLVALL